jgi:hypothetical protein
VHLIIVKCIVLFQQIQLTFDHFDIEYDADCQHDRIIIYDGSRSNYPLLTSPLCGSGIPTVKQSSGHEILIWFITDASEQATGFALNYAVHEIEGIVFLLLHLKITFTDFIRYMYTAHIVLRMCAWFSCIFLWL